MPIESMNTADLTLSQNLRLNHLLYPAIKVKSIYAIFSKLSMILLLCLPLNCEAFCIYASYAQAY